MEAARMGMELERRTARRERVDSKAELIWKDEKGNQRRENGQVVNVSCSGVAVDCPEPVTPSSSLICLAPEIGIAALSQVRHCAWLRSQYRFGLQLFRKSQAGIEGQAAEYDFDELLRTGVARESERFERLYRALAFRYHPDNQETGDPEIFLQIREIHRILSCPRGSASQTGTAADEMSSRPPGETSFAAKNRRYAVLRLLYERRVTDCYSAEMPQREIECLTGLPSNEVQFILWYLREKGAVVSGDSLAYAISASGIDLFDEEFV